MKLIRRMIDDAARGGDRSEPVNDLGAEVVRLARLASSIHLAESARHLAAEPPTQRSQPMRDLVQ